MDEKLILANGTEIRGHLIDTGNILFLYMYDVTMEEMFGLLIEPENVRAIRWERYGQSGEVDGYNHLYTITEERDGMISAGLKKEPQ